MRKIFLIQIDSFNEIKNLKPNGFLMFSGGRERVHWEQMGEKERRNFACTLKAISSEI